MKTTEDGFLSRALIAKKDSAPLRAVAFGPALPRILSGSSGAIAMTNIAQFGVRGAVPEFEIREHEWIALPRHLLQRIDHVNLSGGQSDVLRGARRVGFLIRLEDVMPQGPEHVEQARVQRFGPGRIEARRPEQRHFRRVGRRTPTSAPVVVRQRRVGVGAVRQPGTRQILPGVGEGLKPGESR